MRDIDKIKEKVQKLLNQAADQEGSPEGELFYAKAFALMATYGFDERDLDHPDEGDEIIRKTYTFSGSYTDMQARLLLAISDALHCTGYFQRAYHSTRAQSATVFGARRHMERVEMLYSLLSPAMITGAQRIRARSWADSVVVMRRSFMTGFTMTIAGRLREAEGTVASEDGGYALALIDDTSAAQRACEDFAQLEGLVVGNYRGVRSFHGDAFERGQYAGDMTDLGQTRVQARPALPF